ncbi:hypothetical protein BXZ70DRAFT_92336 [Cristinia sonorae]|uniref:F-box domain-containing protein n=1 Tax=Cristinia sonorae TaxID=1940300 RepID=A0A8K0XQM0_9AGAR|nr:hypothetical protein BXZ70DRAFT_92336 [Cristinia sonorae]
MRPVNQSNVLVRVSSSKYCAQLQTPPPPQSQLPLEVIAVVISCLQDVVSWGDKSAFGACALACRAWTAEARKHLFESIRVDSAADMFNLVAQVDAAPPYLPLLVQKFYAYEHIECSAGQIPWAQLVQWFIPQRFPNLQTVNFCTSLRPLQPRCLVPEPVAAYGYRLVTTFVLEGWTFADFMLLRKMVDVFPALRDLRCHDVKLGRKGYDYIEQPVSHALCNLQRISTMNCRWVFSRCLFLWAIPTSILRRHLEIPMFLLDDIRVLCSLIDHTVCWLTGVLLSHPKCPLVMSRDFDRTSKTWIYSFAPESRFMTDIAVSFKYSPRPQKPKHPSAIRFSIVTISVKPDLINFYVWPTIDCALQELQTIKKVCINFLDAEGIPYTPPMDELCSKFKSFESMPFVRSKLFRD